MKTQSIKIMHKTKTLTLFNVGTLFRAVYTTIPFGPHNYQVQLGKFLSQFFLDQSLHWPFEGQTRRPAFLASPLRPKLISVFPAAHFDLFHSFNEPREVFFLQRFHLLHSNIPSVNASVSQVIEFLLLEVKINQILGQN